MGIFGFLGRAAKGFLTGGPIGLAGAVIGGAVGRQAGRAVATQPIQPGFPRLPELRPVGVGRLKERAPFGIRVGGRELQPTALFPGGLPAIRTVNGVRGPAAPFVGEIGGAPVVHQVRRCPRGQVLAIDGRCYPKALVPRAFREVPPQPKPAVSARDVKAIRRSAAAKKRLVKLTKDAGAHASLSRPRK